MSDFKAWADGLVDAQTVHLTNALRDKLATKLREAYKRGRKDARAEMYTLFYRLETFVLDHGPMGHVDHACARCVPGGPMVIEGFECAVHIAHDLRAARLEREQQKAADRARCAKAEAAE